MIAKNSGQVSVEFNAYLIMDFTGGLDSKESASIAEDLGSIPGSGRSSGNGNGYPLHYSCLENPHGQRSLVGYSHETQETPDVE